MPPTRHREREDFHRNLNRSLSPPHKKKRSWLSSSSSSHYDRSHPRSPPPKKKDYNPPPPKPSHHQPSSSYSRHSRSRSRSPKYGKRDEGFSRYPSSKDSFNKPKSPVRVNKSEFVSRQDSRSRKRSLSPVRSSKDHYNSYTEREKDIGIASKKKPRQSTPPLPVQKKSHPGGRSPSPISPPRSSSRRHEQSHRNSDRDKEKDNNIPQRKVSSSLFRKKTNHATLHSRFTDEDIGPFHLQANDNVTIAILRNPRAEPSDDVTVKKIFDSSLFKMVHKKTEGRRPIFDRDEIKVWKHDENLDDDPDFEERRLVRVKATTKKKPADSSSLRMSPDLLRKSLGVSNKSGSRSPHRSPNIRLNPQPDSRYESRFQQQIKRDEKRKDGGDNGRRGRDVEGGGRFQSTRGGERDGARQSDLREALERRRSGRDEDFERGGRDYSDPRKHHNHDDRNVVVDQDRARRFEDGGNFRERGRGFQGERRGWGRGRGRGPRRQWSPIRTNQEDRDDYNARDRAFDRRDRFGSPVNSRGRGSGAFRGRSQYRDVDQYEYEEEDPKDPPTDNYYKYTQHDDRDVSPRSLRGGRGRGVSNRFQSSRGFRGIRGRFFGSGARRGFGFRDRGRGRGLFNRGDSRSVERDDRRSIEHGSDREWKHDMYDTVQSDDEMPHSTTVNN